MPASSHRPSAEDACIPTSGDPSHPPSRLRQHAGLADEGAAAELFHDPDDVVGRLFYARALARAGARRRALFHLNMIIAQLARTPGTTVMADGRTTVARFLSTTRDLKERLA